MRHFFLGFRDRLINLQESNMLTLITFKTQSGTLINKKSIEQKIH